MPVARTIRRYWVELSPGLSTLVVEEEGVGQGSELAESRRVSHIATTTYEGHRGDHDANEPAPSGEAMLTADGGAT